MFNLSGNVDVLLLNTIHVKPNFSTLYNVIKNVSLLHLGRTCTLNLMAAFYDTIDVFAQAEEVTNL